MWLVSRSETSVASGTSGYYLFYYIKILEICNDYQMLALFPVFPSNVAIITKNWFIKIVEEFFR